MKSFHENVLSKNLEHEDKDDHPFLVRNPQILVLRKSAQLRYLLRDWTLKMCTKLDSLNTHSANLSPAMVLFYGHRSRLEMNGM